MNKYEMVLFSILTIMYIFHIIMRDIPLIGPFIAHIHTIWAENFERFFRRKNHIFLSVVGGIVESVVNNSKKNISNTHAYNKSHTYYYSKKRRRTIQSYCIICNFFFFFGTEGMQKRKLQKAVLVYKLYHNFIISMILKFFRIFFSLQTVSDSIQWNLSNAEKKCEWYFGIEFESNLCKFLFENWHHYQRFPFFLCLSLQT